MEFNPPPPPESAPPPTPLGASQAGVKSLIKAKMQNPWLPLAFQFTTSTVNTIIIPIWELLKLRPRDVVNVIRVTLLAKGSTNTGLPDPEALVLNH